VPILFWRTRPCSQLRAPGRLRNAVPWYDRFKFGLVRWFLAAWVRLFSLRGLYFFGRWFGFIEYLINFKRRARYRRELADVFPEGLPPARAGRSSATISAAHAATSFSTSSSTACRARRSCGGFASTDGRT